MTTESILEDVQKILTEREELRKENATLFPLLRLLTTQLFLSVRCECVVWSRRRGNSLEKLSIHAGYVIR